MMRSTTRSLLLAGIGLALSRDRGKVVFSGGARERKLGPCEIESYMRY